MTGVDSNVGQPSLALVFANIVTVEVPWRFAKVNCDRDIFSTSHPRKAICVLVGQEYSNPPIDLDISS